MRTTRVRGRKVALGFLLAGGGAILAAPAGACEGEYEIQAGDTLSSIAVACETTLSVLRNANEVDASRLQLGQVIRIPAADDPARRVKPVARDGSRTRPASADPGEPGSGYVVQPGDTPAKIARELGISLDTLLAANEGLNPRAIQVGQVLNVPDDEDVQAFLAEREAERRRLQRWAEEYPDPRITLSKGDWRMTVDVQGDGFAPGEMVEVAIGADADEWIALGAMPADEAGRFFARARIPAEFADREEMRIALKRPWGDRVVGDYRHDRTKPIVTAVDDAPSEIVVHNPPEVEDDVLEDQSDVEAAEAEAR